MPAHAKHIFTTADEGRQVWIPSDDGKGWRVGTVARNPYGEETRRPFVVIPRGAGGIYVGMFSFVNPNAHHCRECPMMRGNHSAERLVAGHAYAEAEGAWMVQGISREGAGQ